MRFDGIHIVRFVLVFLLIASSAHSRRLILCGTSYIPPEAMQRFVDWAGKENAKVLAISFGTEYAEEQFESARDELFQNGIPRNRIERAPTFQEISLTERRSDRVAVLRPDIKARFLRQIETATAFYFGAGTQAFHMAILNDPDIRRALRRRILEENIPVIGGSAGTHIQSETMIQEDASDTHERPYNVVLSTGLGLLSEAITDSHFLRRAYRSLRLKGALMQKGTRETLGIGIDNGAAIIVEGDQLTAVGSSNVEVWRRMPPDNDFMNYVLSAGDRFDLRSQSRVRGSELDFLARSYRHQKRIINHGN